MRRFVFALLVVAMAGAMVALLLMRDHAPGPEEAEAQHIVDADGVSETWQVRKKELPADERAGRVLPQPDPSTQRSGTSNDDALLLNDRALQAAETGDIRGALELFEAAVSGAPSVAPPYTNYGRLLTQMAAYEEALPLLERAAQLEPEDPQVWLNLQTLYERAVQLERAYYARKQAEALAPGWRIVRDAKGFYTLEGT